NLSRNAVPRFKRSALATLIALPLTGALLLPQPASALEGGPPAREGERKEGARRETEAGQATLLVSPIRSDMEANRLREALAKMEGVREVAIRPVPGRPQVGQ